MALGHKERTRLCTVDISYLDGAESSRAFNVQMSS